MAKTLSNAQLQTLTLTLGVLSELGLSETQPVKKAALSYCAGSLLEIVAPARAPAAAVTQAAPAATAIDTGAPAAPPEPAKQAARSAAAAKANATRKANKNRAAGTAGNDGPAEPTRSLTGDSCT